VIQETSLRRRALIGGVVLLAGVVVLAVGLFASAGILAVGIGAAVTFVGVAMLAPFMTGPLRRPCWGDRSHRSPVCPVDWARRTRRATPAARPLPRRR